MRESPYACVRATGVTSAPCAPGNELASIALAGDAENIDSMGLRIHVHPVCCQGAPSFDTNGCAYRTADPTGDGSEGASV